MPSTLTKVIVTFISLVLAVLPVWSVVTPNGYFVGTTYSGNGKHPSSSQIGLIIERSATGDHFACFLYTLITDREIKGRTSVRTELVTPEGIRVLQSFNNVRVEGVELGEGTSVDPCTGEEVVIPGLDSNYGSIVECKVLSASLKSGDVVRWVFEFKKMSKLKGDFPLFQVFGQIIQSSRGLTAQEARSVLLEEWTRQWSPLQRGSTLFSE